MITIKDARLLLPVVASAIATASKQKAALTISCDGGTVLMDFYEGVIKDLSDLYNKLADHGINSKKLMVNVQEQSTQH